MHERLSLKEPRIEVATIKEEKTHPPLNAPIGLRIGKTADEVSSLRLEVWKDRVGWRNIGTTEADLDMRREGARSLKAMVFVRVSILDWIVLGG